MVTATMETAMTMTDEQAYEWVGHNLPITWLKLRYWVSTSQSAKDLAAHAMCWPRSPEITRIVQAAAVWAMYLKVEEYLRKD